MIINKKNIFNDQGYFGHGEEIWNIIQEIKIKQIQQIQIQFYRALHFTKKKTEYHPFQPTVTLLHATNSACHINNKSPDIKKYVLFRVKQQHLSPLLYFIYRQYQESH